MSRAPDGIAGQLAATRAVLERHLGETLEAIHLFGSALDGGLQTFSDVDLMVTVSELLEDPAQARQIEPTPTVPIESAYIFHP
jgi:streptomycin 3"-adenylyltransferase